MQHWRNRISAVILFLAAASLLTVCSEQKQDDAFGGLPPELVRHVVSGSDSALARYVRDHGYSDLRRAIHTLTGREVDLWRVGREDDARAAMVYPKRLAAAFAAERNTPFELRDIEFRQGLSREAYDKLIRARYELHSLTKQSQESAKNRVDAYNLLTKSFASLGDSASVAMCTWHIAFAHHELGHIEDYESMLRRAYVEFATLGNHYMTCQALGNIGADFEKKGNLDSMVVCYEEALRIANRCRIGDQAARILTFYAAHYGRQGRIDLERLLLLRAVDVARDYNSGYREIRYIYEAMRFHADLGCWDVVEDLLARAQGVKRRGMGKDLRIFEINFLRTDITEARLRMAYGDVTGADRILDRVLGRLEQLKLPHPYRVEDDIICFYRAKGYLHNNRAEAALAAAGEALSRPPEESAPDWSARLALVKAQAALELQDVETAEEALAEFDRFSVGLDQSLRRELTDRDALGGRILLKKGETHEALAALAAGIARLERTAATIDASVESYLWLSGCDGLRSLMHELVSNDPLSGYGAEMLWRNLYGTLGTEDRRDAQHGTARSDDGLNTQFSARSNDEFIRGIRARADRALTRLATLDGVHCVYVVVGGEVWRWTASPRGVRRDVLSVSAEELGGWVNRAVQMMADHPRDRDTPPGSELHRLQRKLALALLPPGLLGEPGDSGGDPAVVYITTDRFLGQIPFGAFDVGQHDSYEPLLSRIDVAYLRCLHDIPPRSAAGSGIILVNSDAMTRHHNRLVTSPQLREVEPEANAVYRLNPDAVYLSGIAANKRQLTSHWESAPYIYMATHTVWDPELPYLAMIPLVVSPKEPAPDAGFLDISDIRGADLGGCDIVVLSGCSSGVPYVEHHTAGPSLGDAFLDAGTGAVVHTFWNVTDRDARRIGTGFIGAWEKDGASMVQALCEARRNEMRGPRGIRHPSCWASYAIKLSRF